MAGNSGCTCQRSLQAALRRGRTGSHSPCLRTLARVSPRPFMEAVLTGVRCCVAVAWSFSSLVLSGVEHLVTAI